MSQVINAMVGFRRELLNRDEASLREMAVRWQQVESRLLGDIIALVSEMRDQGITTPTLYQLSRSRRFQTLMAQVREQMTLYREYTDQAINERQTFEALRALQEYPQLISAAASDAGVTVQFDRMTPSAVERMTGVTGSEPLRSTLERASILGPEAMIRELVTGLALGKNPNQIARDMVRNGMGRSFRRFATIARTEVMRVHRQTILEGYRDSGVVTAYQRVASKSLRTCFACLILDGTVYPLEEEFPQHPNCRCQLIPILVGRGAIEYKRGLDWFLGLEPSKQRQIMGPGNFRRWTGSTSSLRDFIYTHEDPVWGPSPRTRSLRSWEAEEYGSA